MSTLLEAKEVTKIYVRAQHPSLNKVSFSAIECDVKLITHTVNNLVQNSIHSNPGSCTIILMLQAAS